jgi:hypothetical protein
LHPVYSIKEYYEIKITSKSFAQKVELKWSLGGPCSKLCVAPPFSINFRCQIENQVSVYRLLGASSLLYLEIKNQRHKITLDIGTPVLLFLQNIFWGIFIVIFFLLYSEY